MKKYVLSFLLVFIFLEKSIAGQYLEFNNLTLLEDLKECEKRDWEQLFNNYVYNVFTNIPCIFKSQTKIFKKSISLKDPTNIFAFRVEEISDDKTKILMRPVNLNFLGVDVSLCDKTYIQAENPEGFNNLKINDYITNIRFVMRGVYVFSKEEISKHIENESGFGAQGMIYDMIYISK